MKKLDVCVERKTAENISTRQQNIDTKSHKTTKISQKLFQLFTTFQVLKLLHIV